jgi:hypothetical protein
MKLEFSREIFKKYSNIKFQENPSSGSRVIPCGRKEERKEERKKGRMKGRKEGRNEGRKEGQTCRF